MGISVRSAVVFGTIWCSALLAGAAPAPGALVKIDFASPPAALTIHGGAKIARQAEAAGLEFTTATQFAQLPVAGKLHGVEGMTVTAWVYPRRRAGLGRPRGGHDRSARESV